MIDVQSIATTSLGDRSYLAHDGRVALVVDPQRDIDRTIAWTATGRSTDVARHPVSAPRRQS